MSSFGNPDRAMTPPWAELPDVVSGEELVDELRAVADATGDADTEARYRHIADNWKARLLAEERRAVEIAAQIREIQERSREAERRNSLLVERLRKWKQWFAAAMVARWTLRFLERDAPHALLEAIAARRSEAESYVAKRLREQDADAEKK